MNDYLKDAREYIAYADAQAASHAAQMAQAAAAIAQAESAERQADTQESIMALVRRQTEAMERISQTLVTIAGAMGER